MTHRGADIHWYSATRQAGSGGGGFDRFHAPHLIPAAERHHA